MDTLALILSIIGCVNWGLVGIFRFDLVAWLFGGSGALPQPAKSTSPIPARTLDSNGAIRGMFKTVPACKGNRLPRSRGGATGTCAKGPGRDGRCRYRCFTSPVRRTV